MRNGREMRSVLLLFLFLLSSAAHNAPAFAATLTSMPHTKSDAEGSPTRVSSVSPLSLSALASASSPQHWIEQRAAAAAVGVLTPTEYRLFVESLSLVKEPQCRDDLNATLRGIVAQTRWAIAMYDAMAKSSFGIESGMLHQFGHYDECLDQNRRAIADDNGPVRAQYCLTDVAMNGLTVHDIATRHEKPTNYTMAHWGACLPASCGADDVATHLRHLLQRDVSVDERQCQVQRTQLVVTDAMLAYAVVMLFFVLLAVLSTGFHLTLIYSGKRDDADVTKSLLHNETLFMALLSFSIIENTKKMFQASKDQLSLNSINGIKALAMLLILYGHGLSFIYGGPVYNAAFIAENIKRPTFAFLSNSLLFVDTFLLLSGFLFCRILLIELERRRGKINVLVLYVARYIRLTPAYMAIIGFYMTWLPVIGDGPLWRQRIEREQQRCMESWWLNILYINNYINTNKLCMFQSWYLSVDSQLFFVAPIAIYLLHRSRTLGVRFLFALIAITSAIPFAVTYVQKLDPTLLVYADEMGDLSSNPFYIGSYIKTHMRASAYVVGLLTGYLVHIIQEKGIRLSSIVVRATWLLATVIGVASMFAVSHFYVHPSFSSLDSTMYAGFHKLGWNFAVAWLVLAVTTGHAGRLQRMLSSRFFAPISRLTYCAYLSNGIVELYHSSTVRTPVYLGYVSLTNDVFSHVVNTFTLAFLLCLLFESPIHALERILLRKVGRSERSGAGTAANDKADSQTPSTSEEQMA